MSKTKCYSVRILSMDSISDKAVKIQDFNGNTDIFPKSAIFGEDFEVQNSNAVWIAAWILEKKSITYSAKKESWFDSAERNGVTIEKHTPEPIAPVDTEASEELSATVRGYVMQWRECRVVINGYGKKKDGKRQFIVTYEGAANKAPKDFIPLSPEHFEAAKKFEQQERQFGYNEEPNFALYATAATV